MKRKPKIVAFDVIETLFSLDAVKQRMQAVGLPEATLQTWFSGMLRDAMALEITGDYVPFREVAESTLQGVMVEMGAKPGTHNVKNVLDGFAELTPHPDVEPAFRMLRDGGVRLITLTNGSEKNTTTLLKNAKLNGYVEKSLSIDDVKHWKPSKEVYLHAAREMNVEPKEITLVAAHGWDIHGANRAGLGTAYINRGRPSPAVMQGPDLEGTTLDAIARTLLQPA